MSSKDVKGIISPPKHVKDANLLEPYRYINGIPGKDVRGKLIDCFQLWFNIESRDDDSNSQENFKENDAIQSIKEIVGDLHNASLLIDDIEDNSKLRRGIPVAHSIFGVAPTINCANYVYFFALEKCHELKNPYAMSVFVSEILNLHRGQGQDIYWRDHIKCPSEDEYCKMVIDKTGGLFRLAVGLMQAFATTNKKTDFIPLVNSLAMYFQIRDDLINLADEEYMKSKSFCEDLTEGKFSFPIIHCVQKDTSDTKLISILKQRTEDVDIKRYAQGLLRDAGSLRYTREKCKRLKKEIIEHVASLGGNEPLLKLVEILDVQVEGIEKSILPSTPVNQQISQLGKASAGHGQIDST